MPSAMLIKLSNKEDDIFTAKEKKQEITIKIADCDENDDENEEEFQVNNATIDGINESLMIKYQDNEDEEHSIELSFRSRFLQDDDTIFICNTSQRKIDHEITFATESIAEKLMKIIWKYKTNAASANEITSVPPAPTITHSNHDIAAVFSFEELHDPIHFSTSEESEKRRCSIFIDVEKEVIIVKPSGEAESFELQFRQITTDELLTFEREDGSDIRLELYKTETEKKIKKMIKTIPDIKETLDQEVTALESSLKNFVVNQNVEEIKKILQVYVKRFTIFKEEHRQQIFEIYQKYNVHEMIHPPPSVNVKIEVKEEESEFSGLSQKRRAAEDDSDEIPIKKNKKSENSDDDVGMTFVRYPYFEFQCDETGAPKQKLIIFSETDKKMCLIFKQSCGTFECSECIKTTRYPADTRYCMNKYGERFLLFWKGVHCHPLVYEAEEDFDVKRVTGKVIEEEATARDCDPLSYFSKQHFNLFSPSKNYAYEFEEIYMQAGHEISISYCKGCYKKEKKYVYAKYDEDTECYQILDEDHVCVPKEYCMPIRIEE